MLELRDARRDHVAALLARPARFGLRLRQAVALDHVVAEYNDGARHLADFVARSVAGIRAVVSPSARRFMTDARPLSGRVMLRPISQLKSKTDGDHRDTDRDDAGTCTGLRCGKALAPPRPRSLAHIG